MGYVPTGKTIDELYEAYMDEDRSFGEDVYEFFGGDRSSMTSEDWAADYAHLLPTFDPARLGLASRTRDLDYEKAKSVLNISTNVADRIYDTEVDTISTGLESDLAKGKAVSGSIGLRSGSLEAALGDATIMASNKIKTLSDRLGIQMEESDNAFKNAIVDTSLDFEKTERQQKQELYDRTMRSIQNLIGAGAFVGEGGFAYGEDCGEGLTYDPDYGCVLDEDWEDRHNLFLSGGLGGG